METTRKLYFTWESYNLAKDEILKDRRQQSSVIRTAYCDLKSYPTEERPTANEAMKHGSNLMNKLGSMNNIERVNYILRNSAIMLASSYVASDDTKKKEDDKKEEKLKKKIEKNTKKLETKKRLYNNLLQARRQIISELNSEKITEKKKDYLKKRLQTNSKKLSDKGYRKAIICLEKSIRSANRKLLEIDERRKQGYNRIFGGKYSFEQRSKQNITHDEFTEKRLQPLYVFGDKEHGNRLFEFTSETEILYKRDKDHRYHLKLDEKRLSKKDKDIIRKLMLLKSQGKIAMTMSLGDGFICITYDIDDLKQAEPDKFKYTFVKNRFLGIDSGPNELGVSIVEWTGPSTYKLLYYDVFSIRKLNDEWFDLNVLQNVSSDDQRRIHNSNCRNTLTSQMVAAIASLAKHWQVEGVCAENLGMSSEDTEKGSKFNSMVNNLWPHTKIESWMMRQCNEIGIRYISVNPKYSSIGGNLLFRKEENVPDPCLAAIEMTRRGYEVLHQYILKDKAKRKNIVFADEELFGESLRQSVEEIFRDDNRQFDSVQTLFKQIAKGGTMYRRKLESCDLRFRKLNSSRSHARTVFYNTGCGRSVTPKSMIDKISDS